MFRAGEVAPPLRHAPGASRKRTFMDDEDEAAIAASEEALLADCEQQPEQMEDDHGDDTAAGEADEAEEGASARPSRRRSPQDRIDEVTRARREAERERDYWRQEAERAQYAFEPEPAQFAHGEVDPDYLQALGVHTARAEFQRLSQERERLAQAHAVETSWNARQEAFASARPDYFEALAGDWPCSAPMADAIRTSEDGAHVAYHLARNPDQARRIAGLEPLAQIREIGRLEARLTKAAGSSSIRAYSGAPSPAPFGRGGGGRFKIDPATSDFAAFEKQYGDR